MAAWQEVLEVQKLGEGTKAVTAKTVKQLPGIFQITVLSLKRIRTSALSIESRFCDEVRQKKDYSCRENSSKYAVYPNTVQNLNTSPTARLPKSVIARK